MAKSTAKDKTLTKSSLKVESGSGSSPKYTRKYDNLVSFQFKIFNPLKWAMLYLQRIEQDRDGKITLHIPFIWYLAFLLFMVGGSSAMGALLTGPTSYVQGQIAERMLWQTMPTPTPIVIIPTPAPLLVTKLGTLKATYQVRDMIPSPTPASASATESAEMAELALLTKPPLRYVLLTENDDLIFLTVPINLSLNNLVGNRVLVTGYFDVFSRNLALHTTDDVEVVY